MKLSAVGILVTYRCSIKCRHCYINCGPNRTGVIELDLADRLLRQVKEIGVEVFGEDRVTVSRQEYLDSPDDWPDLAAFANSFPPMLMGRAYECLRHYPARKPLDEIAQERCEGEVSPEAMREVHINPDGSIMPSNCSGIILGDAWATTLSDLCGTDDWRKSDIPRLLADRGPAGLLDMAPGFVSKETYAQRCELCWEVRSFLSSAHPGTLALPEGYAGAM